MKNLIKDRKTLSLVLCLVLVCVFTLTIAYSALSAVLTIQGNARVSASDWDIYFNNPRVTNGSATTDVPIIRTSSTLEFSTTLNMPGDFYEFVVDVVNAGDIDAMIENVVKTPDLTEEQAKFLKYEVSYQNGEAITTKQLLSKDTTMPIKVRIEYRKDLNNADLPIGQVVLDLSLTLEYIQSDGSASSVTNNGVSKVLNVKSGSLDAMGSEVCIGDECFYVLSSDETSVTLLTKYNLYVGGYITTNYCNSGGIYGGEATGLQDSTMRGWVLDVHPTNGVIPFASDLYWKGTNSEYPANVDISGSTLYPYINNYKTYINTLGANVEEARLLNLYDLSIVNCSVDEWTCEDAPKWVYETTYWTSVGSYEGGLFIIRSDTAFTDYYYDENCMIGLRPVLKVTKN